MAQTSYFNFKIQVARGNITRITYYMKHSKSVKHGKHAITIPTPTVTVTLSSFRAHWIFFSRQGQSWQPCYAIRVDQIPRERSIASAAANDGLHPQSWGSPLVTDHPTAIVARHSFRGCGVQGFSAAPAGRP